MSDTRENRRLAAVLAADVVGYSRLMESDEAGTLRRLKDARKQVLEPAVKDHGGRIVKNTGDGALVEFPSAVDAVRCAIAIQSVMSERDAGASGTNRLLFRIGVHLGDLIIDEDDIYGDGVNIAARLEGLAAPGGVAISGSIQEHIAGKIQTEFSDAGEQHVKNIARAVHIWLWRPDQHGQDEAAKSSPEAGPKGEQKPLLAVLRFATSGADPEVEDLAEALADDLTTAFSARRGIEVVARGATASFKGVSGDMSAVREATRADFVLAGALRRSGNRIRITAELLETVSGVQIWSSRYDRELTDWFALADEITDRIALAARTAMNAYEGRRYWDRPVQALGNAERRAKAAEHFYRFTKADFVEAERLLDAVLASNPEDAMALSMQAFCFMAQGFFDVHKFDRDAADRALDMAARAVQLDRNSDYAFETRGLLALHLHQDCEAALADARRALALTPQYGLAIQLEGEALIYCGQPWDGIQRLKKVIEYDPRDPINYVRYGILAMGYFATEEYGEAVSAIEQARSGGLEAPVYDLARVAILEQLGRHDAARQAVDDIAAQWPDVTLETIKIPPFRDAEVRDRYREALRKAGIPD